MSRIQSGDRAPRTDAEDEEQKPSATISPPPWLAPSERFWILPYPLDAGCNLLGVFAAGFGDGFGAVYADVAAA
jgi:hypothetical protein